MSASVEPHVVGGLFTEDGYINPPMAATVGAEPMLAFAMSHKVPPKSESRAMLELLPINWWWGKPVGFAYVFAFGV